MQKLALFMIIGLTLIPFANAGTPPGKTSPISRELFEKRKVRLLIIVNNKTGIGMNKAIKDLITKSIDTEKTIPNHWYMLLRLSYVNRNKPHTTEQIFQAQLNAEIVGRYLRCLSEGIAEIIHPTTLLNIIETNKTFTKEGLVNYFDFIYRKLQEEKLAAANRTSKKSKSSSSSSSSSRSSSSSSSNDDLYNTMNLLNTVNTMNTINSMNDSYSSPSMDITPTNIDGGFDMPGSIL